MTLVLTINGIERLDNGESPRMRLDRHGALIGRSPHMDWCLPDTKNYISSSHCEIEYRDGGYVLIDKSTNGTYVNRSTERLGGPYPIVDGDVIQIGQYEIIARLETAGGARTAPPPAAEPAQPAWGGWDSQSPKQQEPVGMDQSRWDRPEPQAAISGQGSASSSWSAPKLEPVARSSSWGESAAAAPAGSPSAWSSEPRAPADPSAADVWGQLASTNEVDWGRGGFGSTASAFAASDAMPPVPSSAPAETGGWGAPSQAPPAQSWGAPESPASSRGAFAPAPQAQPAAPPAGGGGQEFAAFLAAVGLQPSDIKTSPVQAMTAAGALMKILVGGMVVMMEARARAKAQLGAANTSLEFDGNNPLKFARSADKAVAQLLGPAERGFMPADRAVEDAFRDLQAHQLATLAAMQGALAETLDRFSPAAIRERAESRGLLAKIMPGASAAALWQAYEREFEGVTKGSDEAFMDVFAKEFREAYERVAAEMKQKQR